ncbi:DUF881 domain-containing protein [Nocardioides dongkuii]|uniref:DUF881 domain-containing protein n=1 Tax=Nocardioides dongkuii TaxID=2760089 RepID=UPI0015F9C447|nr:DUF881 domain-containing protein [Nocardioides dongkuii]
MSEPTPGPRDPRLPPRVTMPLLTLITQQSMDEDYLHAAERRIERGAGPPRGRPRLTGAVVVAVFGLLISVAAVQTSRNADVESEGREQLIQRITEERTAVSGLQDRIALLRERNAELDEGLTEVSGILQSARDELRRVQVRTGYVEVRGPGVRMTVEDPEQGDEEVRKEDLFLLVNALWAGGAEAVSLNGQRLSVLTTISNSDVAINVDSRALLPPYTLLAIGDGGRLAANVSDTTTFATFEAVRERYGFGFTMQNEETIVLPAAREKRLSFATPLTDDDVDKPTDKGTAP